MLADLIGDVLWVTQPIKQVRDNGVLLSGLSLSKFSRVDPLKNVNLDLCSQQSSFSDGHNEISIIREFS